MWGENMDGDNSKRKPWLTTEFETAFRKAMGRDMTSEELSFFGLENRSKDLSTESKNKLTQSESESK